MNHGSASAQASCIVTSDNANQGDSPQQQSPPAAASLAAEAEHDQEEKLSQLTRERDELKAELLLKAALNPSSEFRRILDGTDEGGKVLPCFCVHIHLSLFLSFSLTFCIPSLSPLPCGHSLDVLARKLVEESVLAANRMAQAPMDQGAASPMQQHQNGQQAPPSPPPAQHGELQDELVLETTSPIDVQSDPPLTSQSLHHVRDRAPRAGVRNEETLLDVYTMHPQNQNAIYDHIHSLTHMQMQSVTTIVDVYVSLYKPPTALRWA